jgi:ribose-phosphate pyrophosphokinase
VDHSNFCIFSGSSYPQLAKEIADILHMEVSPATIKEFSCGEIYVNLDESVRGKEVFIVQTTRTGNVNKDFMELFLLCDAAKRSFASKVHVVLPYYSYARQDKIHAAREPISARLFADILVKSGADRIITMHLHSEQIQAFFDVPVDNLNSRKMLANIIQEKNLHDPIIVSPDAGGAKMAKRFADELNLPIAILHKTRPEHNVSEITHIVGDITNKTPIIIDDMVDTAGSVCSAKQALIDKGSLEDVYLVSTHPVFSGPAIERLKNAQFKEIIVTNTLPLLESQFIENLTQVSVAPLLAEVIKNTIENKPISNLYF